MRSQRVPPRLPWLLCALAVAACEQEARLGSGNEDVRLDQDVTNRPPQDPIFADFEKNWRKFVTEVPAFTLPVRRPEAPEEQPRWEPLVIAECVFSEDVGAQVPRVTLTWNEPLGDGGDVEIEPDGDDGATAPPPAGVATPPGTVAAAPRTTVTGADRPERDQVVVPPGDDLVPPDRGRPPGDDGRPSDGGQPPSGSPPDVPTERVDLALHHDGFGRNYYSTALTSELRERFRLPANSGLVADQEAVMLTGPALFPRLTDFRSDTLRARDTGERFRRRTLVLSDLSEGLTYNIRLSGRGDDVWNEERQFYFLTPICHEDF